MKYFPGRQTAPALSESGDLGPIVLNDNPPYHAKDECWPSFLDRTARLAFILRSDARAKDGFSSETHLEFLMWWLCYGRFEYDVSKVTNEQRELAWQLDDSASQLCGKPLPRILFYLLKRRSDVLQALTGPAEFLADRFTLWFLQFGYKEMNLGDVISPTFLTWLSSTAQAGNCSRLAEIVWNSSHDLQERFPKEDALLSTNYVRWFAQRGASELGLTLFNHAAESAHSLGVNIIGYAGGILGIGEDARMMGACLRNRHIPFAIVDFSHNLASMKGTRILGQNKRSEAPFSINCFCMTGLDTAVFYLQEGSALFERGYNIGYWPWELPIWPEPLGTITSLVDEIWVSSLFTQQSFQPTSKVPVHYMPPAVELPHIIAAPRQRFGLSNDDCIFLFVFDGNSYIARKNPIAVLRAFAKAFPDKSKKVKLIFKIMNQRKDHPDWEIFGRETADDPRVRVINSQWNKDIVISLMANCDVYVSLHRSEGFGRTIAEAMLLGKPVVATAWSGSNELVNPETAVPIPFSLVAPREDDYPWVQGSFWAEPDIDAAATAFRELEADPERRAEIGAKAKSFVMAKHNFDTVGKAYEARLSAIKKQIQG